MKTTTTILFISMFFSATISSMLFSSAAEEVENVDNEQKEEILSLIRKLSQSDLTDNSDELTFDIKPGLYEIDPKKHEITFSTSSGEKILLSPIPDKFDTFIHHALLSSILQSNGKNCKKLLEANADPDWRTRDDDVTPLDLAWALFCQEPKSEKKLAILGLLKELDRTAILEILSKLDNTE